MYENENLEEFKNDMVEDFEVRKQVVSKIISDFTKKGINEARYLIELTTFVLYEIVTQKRVNYPSLVGVIYSGYCQAGLNSIVKNLNSFIEVRRTEWVTALKDHCLSSDAFERFYLDDEDL